MASLQVANLTGEPADILLQFVNQVSGAFEVVDHIDINHLFIKGVYSHLLLFGYQLLAISNNFECLRYSAQRRFFMIVPVLLYRMLTCRLD